MVPLTVVVVPVPVLRVSAGCTTRKSPRSCKSAYTELVVAKAAAKRAPTLVVEPASSWKGSRSVSIVIQRLTI